MTSSITIIVFALSVCISQAANEINMNGDIYNYVPSNHRTFEEAERTCMEMNASLPVTKSLPEFNEVQDIIRRNEPNDNRKSIWLNVQWNGMQFVWIPDGTPVDPNIIPINGQICGTDCCHLIYHQEPRSTSLAYCNSNEIAAVLCVKPFGSQLQSSLRTTQSKANTLGKENQNLRQDVNSLQSARTALFVLVGLLLATVIVLVIGSVRFYKKVKSLLP